MRTEEAILEATMRLLATRGIHGTSLDALAEEVGVSKSSILWHFGSKEELLLRVAERVFEAVASGPVRTIQQLPGLEQRAEATWRLFRDTVRRQPEFRRVMLWLILESADARPELRARLQQLYRNMRELYERGLAPVVADPAQRAHLATASIAMLDGLFIQWLLDPDRVDLDALETSLTRVGGRFRRAMQGGSGRGGGSSHD